MKTRITELLGIEYPIIQGGMAWVAEYHLAAAVSNAGGFGIIGAASAPPEVVREQIREAKRLTDKPFGVNVMLMNPNAAQVAEIVAQEGVKAVTTGAGNPAQFMPLWKEAGEGLPGIGWMVFFMFICFPAALRKINGYPRAWRGSRRQTYESLPPGDIVLGYWIIR